MTDKVKVDISCVTRKGEKDPLTPKDTVWEDLPPFRAAPDPARVSVTGRGTTSGLTVYTHLPHPDMVVHAQTRVYDSTGGPMNTKRKVTLVSRQGVFVLGRPF